MNLSTSPIFSGYCLDIERAYVAIALDADDAREQLDARMATLPGFERFVCPYGGADADEWVSYYRHKATGAQVDVGHIHIDIGDMGFSGVKVQAPWRLFDSTDDAIDGTIAKTTMSLSERLVLGQVMRAIVRG